MFGLAVGLGWTKSSGSGLAWTTEAECAGEGVEDNVGGMAACIGCSADHKSPPPLPAKPRPLYHPAGGDDGEEHGWGRTERTPRGTLWRSSYRRVKCHQFQKHNTRRASAMMQWALSTVGMLALAGSVVSQPLPISGRLCGRVYDGIGGLSNSCAPWMKGYPEPARQDTAPSSCPTTLVVHHRCRFDTCSPFVVIQCI